eukprot:UN22477
MEELKIIHSRDFSYPFIIHIHNDDDICHEITQKVQQYSRDDFCSIEDALSFDAFMNKTSADECNLLKWDHLDSICTCFLALNSQFPTSYDCYAHAMSADTIRRIFFNCYKTAGILFESDDDIVNDIEYISET